MFLKMLKKQRGGLFILFMFLVGSYQLVSAAPGDIQRASVASGGTQANTGGDDEAISADGRFVAFASTATNLVTSNPHGVRAKDVYVHDRQTGVTTRVSVSTGGVEGNGNSRNPSLNANGRFVAFTSSATNLVANDTNGVSDAFVHDRQTGVTTRVSLDSNGAEGNGASLAAGISLDGRYVVMDSDATNLVKNDTNNATDIFVHDRVTSETTRVSVHSSGLEADGASFSSEISGDGNVVTFMSQATNFVNNDIGGKEDIFVHDRTTGQTSRVSVNSAGDAADHHSYEPEINDDGRFVVFQSDARNLAASDTNRFEDVYVHDRQTGETIHVSVDSNGNGVALGGVGVSISGNGRFVSFLSYDNMLVINDNNKSADVFVHDLATGETTRVSVNGNGVEGNGPSTTSALNEDGRFIAFHSAATNFVSNDTNGARDVFVVERAVSSIVISCDDPNSFDTVIHGTAGNDKLEGTAGNDLIIGYGGNDRIEGLGGTDCLIGGEGNDTIYGGDGNDTIWGGEQGNSPEYTRNDADKLYGGDGDDEMYGGGDNDRLQGDNGNDKLVGNAERDKLYGNDGNDYLNGGDDRDTLDGGDGHDELVGGDDDDYLNGKDGHDILQGNGGRDKLYGGYGDDNLDGGSGDDTLHGSDGDDYLAGGSGRDRLDGGDDDDQVWGGPDADRLYGGHGDDLVHGEGGNDFMYGSDGDDELHGGPDNDRIDGGHGEDILYGDAGDDRLYGGQDDDMLDGGADNDRLDGSSGTDRCTTGESLRSCEL